jgi:hypothetical protein
MRKIKMTILAASVAFLAMGYSAYATLVLSGSSTYVSSGEMLTITYSVDDNSGTYTYTYMLNSSPKADLYSFQIGGILNPVNTSTIAVINSDGGSYIINGDSVRWNWSSGSATNETVSYTSKSGPGYYNFTVSDDGPVWSNPPLIPAPVPEGSTVVAGALMLLPLGIGAFRALRKERLA